MSSAIEISISQLSVSTCTPLTGSIPGWAATESILLIDITSSCGEQTDISCASSEKIIEQTDIKGTDYQSWIGNANTFSIEDLSDSIKKDEIKVSSLLGNANTLSMYELPNDDHNKSPITSDNQNSLQGTNLTDWNYFPFPPEEVTQITGNRDMTRYQKTYSFSRHQPVRIRLYRIN